MPRPAHSGPETGIAPAGGSNLDAIRPQPLPTYFRPSFGKQQFGLSDEWFLRHIAAGNIRAVKAGRATLIETASVLDYLARNPVRLTRKAPVQKDRAA